MPPRTAWLFLASLSVAGCGSSSAPTVPSPPQTVGDTLSGTTQTGPTGGCGPTAGHQFQAGDGTVTVTLQQATPPVTLQVQVCYPSAVNEAQTCTIPPFARLDVGQSVSAALKSGRSQVLVVYPTGCGTSAAAPTGVIAYTVTVAHTS
jgi:hypothetical protein